ncbi:MAG: PD-(D/E)XK nuclease family protein [Oscillibacter sp.]|nr:PD-(D/E)XK nuclease family protein [Oscillibacter sp.]
MLAIWMGRARTGKSTRILETIRALGDGGEQILLVPEHASHAAEVDLQRACGDTASRHAEVLSFRRLCDRVLSITGGASETVLDAGGKLLTLQRCMTELSPVLTVYRRPSRKPAFLQKLLDLFDELRAFEVTPELLHEKAGELSGMTADKLRDLSMIYGAYESRLRGRGHDRRDRMSRLCDNLEKSGYVRGKDVFLDGFAYFNAQERRVLLITLKQARSVTVALLGEPNSREEMFSAALRTLWQLRRLAEEAGQPVQVEHMTARASGALGHLERYCFRGGAAYQGDCAEIRVREAANAVAEAEQTAADIVRLVSAGRARYRDITVSARNMEDYLGILQTVFSRWEIPAYFSKRSDILEKPAISLVTGALSAATGGYEYDDMFRWLKTGLGGLSAEECDILENYALKWEVHGAMWTRDADWAEHPDGYGNEWGDEQTARLKRVNRLRARVRETLLPLSEGLKNGDTAAEKTEALYAFLERLQLRETLESRMRAQAEAGRMQEAEETAQLWEILCGVLDQFVEILGGEIIDADTFARLFKQALSQYSVGTIPASLDQVSVSEITRNERHTVKYLFLLGANDHVLPAVGQSGGILNEDDRRELANMGVELSPNGLEQMGMEMQNLYAALVQPTDGLTVSYPAAGAAGEELRPAFIVPRLLALFPSLRVERETGRHEYRLTAKLPALEAAGGDIGGELWNYLERRGDCADALDAMKRASTLKRGSLSRPAVRALYGERLSLSASQMERMRSCHFAFFMRYGLRAKPRDAASFDAPQIGTFLHFLLERVCADAQAMGGFAQVENDALRRLAEKYIDQFVKENFGDLSKKTARFRYLFRRLRNTALEIIEQTADELRHSDFVPVEFELGVGTPSDDGKKPLPAIVIHDPEGELRLKGRIDRVDAWRHGGKLYLRVMDYKSGRKKFDLSNVRMGLDLQMLLYLFALERNGKRRFGEDVEAAGVLYLPARDALLNAERGITEEELEKERAKELKRSGLILSDPEVLQAMEHESLSEPRFLPIRVGKDGGITGDLASAEQLGKLGKYVEKLLRQIGGEVRAGNIDADPCCHSSNDTPCQYCDWAGACHFQDGRDRDRLRYVRKLKPDEFWELLDKESV